ncbi:hypothetical protein F0U59_26745 [Archangium gephyra]|nr:hypothetical protein F0U59_26745 [Archangium gephyra]
MDVFTAVAASLSTLALGLSAGLALGERKRKRHEELADPFSPPMGVAVGEGPVLEARIALLEEPPAQGLWAGVDTGTTDSGHGFVPPVSPPTRGRWALPVAPLGGSVPLEGGTGAQRAGEDSRGEVTGAAVPTLSSVPEFFDL